MFSRIFLSVTAGIIPGFVFVSFLYLAAKNGIGVTFAVYSENVDDVSMMRSDNDTGLKFKWRV